MSVDFPILVDFHEDSSATVLGRITARNGSGAATGKTGEGKFLQQADISTISYKTFDASDLTTAIESGTLTVADVVLDTVVTSTEIWTRDTIGYNFLHDVPATWFPTGGTTYVLEYKFTLTGGAIFFGKFKGEAKSVATS